MSAATATDAPPPPMGKKKLIIIIAAAVLVLALGGVAAMLLLKKKPAEEEGDEEGADSKPVKTAAVKHDPKAAPTFVPLDSFTVNLADREAERYAQVGITLEITDGKFADQIKIFMPAIRMGILMTIADKTAKDLMDRQGKLELARDIQRETSRALGFEVPDEDEGHEAEQAPPPKKGAKKKEKKKAAPAELPIRAVHFSNFIIQ
jgi:flagellar FliL protein